MKLSNQKRERSISDSICAVVLVAIALIGLWNIIRYLILGELVPILTILIVSILFFLVAISAWRDRQPILLLIIGGASGVLYFNMNHTGTATFNMSYLFQTIIGAVGGILAIGFHWKSHEKCIRWIGIPMIAAIVLGLVTSGTWLVCNQNAKSYGGEANRSIWAVPNQFDQGICEEIGSVERLDYQTKAYATDEREVTKSAYVYLPYGYDESKQYDILYLLHGTGDDEKYWLIDHPYNVTMIDQMISKGDVDPFILVTPTWYVEDDCSEKLDLLTYSFAQELQNDLMPAVESKYSTYAKKCDEEGFISSRDHRAFAGLSRGAVTMYHSVLCQSLDYFSWFGAFSGSRTTAEVFKKTIQSEEFKNYPINYLYVSSGNFDFALAGQIQDYQALVEMEPRLTEGENTNMDVYPMRYHSMESWHLALYNYLQKIF